MGRKYRSAASNRIFPESLALYMGRLRVLALLVKYGIANNVFVVVVIVVYAPLRWKKRYKTFERQTGRRRTFKNLKAM